MRALLIFSLLLILLRPAVADCVTGDHFACATLDGFDEVVAALKAGSQNAVHTPGCDYTEPGHKVRVIGPMLALAEPIAIFYGDSAVTKASGVPDVFRSMAHSGWVDVWTVKENVVCN
jgi:hypothetical protein